MCVFFCIQGPDADEEPESELTVTQMKENREKELKEREAAEEEAIMLSEQRGKEKREAEEMTGCSWGFSKYFYNIICTIYIYVKKVETLQTQSIFKHGFFVCN